MSESVCLTTSVVDEYPVCYDEIVSSENNYPVCEAGDSYVANEKPGFSLFQTVSQLFIPAAYASPPVARTKLDVVIKAYDTYQKFNEAMELIEESEDYLKEVLEKGYGEAPAIQTDDELLKQLDNLKKILKEYQPPLYPEPTFPETDPSDSPYVKTRMGNVALMDNLKKQEEYINELSREDDMFVEMQTRVEVVEKSLLELAKGFEKLAPYSGVFYSIMGLQALEIRTVNIPKVTGLKNPIRNNQTTLISQLEQETRVKSGMYTHTLTELTKEKNALEQYIETLGKEYADCINQGADCTSIAEKVQMASMLLSLNKSAVEKISEIGVLEGTEGFKFTYNNKMLYGGYLESIEDEEREKRETYSRLNEPFTAAVPIPAGRSENNSTTNNSTTASIGRSETMIELQQEIRTGQKEDKTNEAKDPNCYIKVIGYYGDNYENEMTDIVCD